MDSTDKISLIRQMRPEDSEGISRIYSVITKQSVNADFSELIKSHAGSKNSVCYVAELDDRIVGFMISYILTLSFEAEKSACIAIMGVDPGCMGKGIGAQLAADSLKFYETQGITRVYTSVKWDSCDVLSFFRTLNFERSDFINLTKKLA